MPAKPALYTPSIVDDIHYHISIGMRICWDLTVDPVVHPFVDAIDLGAYVLRIKVNRSFFGWKKLVEGGVEDTYDLG